MCERCNDPTHAADLLSSGRRRLIFAGAGLAVTPLLTGMANEAHAQQTAPAEGTGPFTTRAYAISGPNVSFVATEISRRAVGPRDVLIDVLYCGVCHTDIHVARGEFGPALYPLVPGHEFVGRVAAVGRDVTKFRVGDVAGVGCMVNSCGTCENCLADLEQFCLNGNTLTYNSPDKVNGGHTMGGYSEKVVVTEKFVIRIPPGADLAATAPLLCAGLTTYSPMQHWKLGPGQRVGIIGLGGLGHMAVKLAAARKADVTVFTTSPGKVADAERLGARRAVVWLDPNALRPLAGQFDLLISTVPKAYPVQPFMNLLRRDGTLVNLGAFDPLQEVRGASLIRGRKTLTGSLIGGVAETQEVVDYCTTRGIKADIELIRPDQVAEAFDRVVGKDVRYRFVIDLSGNRQG